MAFGDQLLSDLNDLRNMVRCARLAVGTQNIQRVKIFVHFGNHAIDQRDKAFAVSLARLMILSSISVILRTYFSL